MISLFFVATATKAQNKIQVTSFNRMETDVTARITAPQRDQNGEVCALIRIVTTEKDLMFEPDALGIVSRENKPGEIWLYIPRGDKTCAKATPEEPKREQRIVCLMSEEELRIVDRYLEKYKITNKSRWLRETILMFIHKNMEEDYPTLFGEHDMRR